MHLVTKTSFPLSKTAMIWKNYVKSGRLTISPCFIFGWTYHQQFGFILQVQHCNRNRSSHGYWIDAANEGNRVWAGILIVGIKQTRPFTSTKQALFSISYCLVWTFLSVFKTRNLKRYIKQLTYAKLQCERRLRVLGAPMSEFSRTTTSTSSYGDEMVPSFKTVMRNNNLRRQLELYLKQQGETQVRTFSDAVTIGYTLTKLWKCCRLVF